MKNTWSFFIIMILLMGCSTPKQTPQVNISIPPVVPQPSGVIANITDMGEALNCVNPIDLRDEHVIMYSDVEYRTLLPHVRPACQNFTLPPINFSQYILVGKYTQGGGCNISFDKKILQDDENKKFIFTSKVTEKGSCEKLGMSMNWVLLLNIPDYKIEFPVTEKSR